jgi:dTDP-4-amino-4,6-dideoxygalactose transaminase
VPDRDRLRAHLGTRHVGTEIYYPVPFHRQTCFTDVTRPDDRFPVADAVADTCLALPIYAELSAAQQAHVVASIAEFYRA